MRSTLRASRLHNSSHERTLTSPSISGVEYTGVNPAALAGFRLSAPSGYQAAFYAAGKPIPFLAMPRTGN